MVTTPPVSKDSLRRYGITVEEYNSILKLQNYVCAGCHRPPNGRRLAVDHKHQRNERKASPEMRRPLVRGELCYACNAALAKVRDNPTTLRNLANYLDDPPATGVILLLPSEPPRGSSGVIKLTQSNSTERITKQPRTYRRKTTTNNTTVKE